MNLITRGLGSNLLVTGGLGSNTISVSTIITTCTAYSFSKSMVATSVAPETMLAVSVTTAIYCVSIQQTQPSAVAIAMNVTPNIEVGSCH